MAQAGIHGLAGMAVRKWTPSREWLMTGIVLGNLLPDADNLAVAVATVAGLPTEGLHAPSLTVSSPLQRSRLLSWGVTLTIDRSWAIIWS